MNAREMELRVHLLSYERPPLQAIAQHAILIYQNRQNIFPR